MLLRNCNRPPTLPQYSQNCKSARSIYSLSSRSSTPMYSSSLLMMVSCLHEKLCIRSWWRLCSSFPSTKMPGSLRTFSHNYQGNFWKNLSGEKVMYNGFRILCVTLDDPFTCKSRRIFGLYDQGIWLDFVAVEECQCHHDADWIQYSGGSSLVQSGTYKPNMALWDKLYICHTMADERVRAGTWKMIGQLIFGFNIFMT